VGADIRNAKHKKSKTVVLAHKGLLFRNVSYGVSVNERNEVERMLGHAAFLIQCIEQTSPKKSKNYRIHIGIRQ
jgi:hypothetical protein